MSQASNEGTTMNEIDEDVLREYAENAFERPRDAAFWDERCYTTHVPVMSWAERGDDILEESNYHTALDLIRSAADDGNSHTEVSDEHVFDGTSSHWAVGSLRQIWVQVYETPECEGHYDDDFTLMSGVGIGEATYCDGTCVPERDREFTAAFSEAVSIAESLKDSAVLDDSDYSEREWEAYEKTLTEAVDLAQRDYLDDSIAESKEIAERWYEDEDTQHRSQWCRPDDVDWDVVETEYREARDAYFTERATEIRDELSRLGLLIMDNRPQPGPGQLELQA